MVTSNPNSVAARLLKRTSIMPDDITPTKLQKADLRGNITRNKSLLNETSLNIEASSSSGNAVDDFYQKPEDSLNTKSNRIGLGGNAKIIRSKHASPKGLSLPPIYPPNPTAESHLTDQGSIEM